MDEGDHDPAESDEPPDGHMESSTVLSLRHVLIGTFVLAVTGLVVFVLGSWRSYTPSDTPSTGSFDRRSEVSIDEVPLPEVELDTAVDRSAFELTPEIAERIATDAVTDLLLEARAVRLLDPELATAGSTGPRLAEMTNGITELKDNPMVEFTDEVFYTFDSLTVTLFKPDDGPQTPPQLAVHMTGTVSGSAGSVDMDDWFTVVPVAGVHLVTAGYDSDREVLVPAPLDPGIAATSGTVESGNDIIGDMTATPDELAGLGLVNRAAEMGLTLQHSLYALDSGENYRVGGAAVADIDGDGYPDIFLPRIGFPDVLYRNDNGERFVDVTIGSGIGDVPTDKPITGGSTTAALVDIDGDGHVDLITLGMAGTPNRLLLGDGAGHFEDATTRWGLPAGPNTEESDVIPIGVVVSDVDHDDRPDVLLIAAEPTRIHGALDQAGISDSAVCDEEARAVVTNLPTAPSHTILLRNTGSGFEDITDRLGVHPSRISASAAGFVDLDGDGWDDLVITGDSCTTTVLRNDHGSFIDVTDEAGFAGIPNGTAVALLDVAIDGEIDEPVTTDHPEDEADAPPDPERNTNSIRSVNRVAALFISGVAHAAGDETCSTSIPLYSCSTNRLMAPSASSKSDDASQGPPTSPLDTSRITFPEYVDIAADQRVEFAGWAWGVSTEDLNNDGYDDVYTTSGVRTMADWFDRLWGDGTADSFWSRSPDQLWIGADGPPLRSVTEDVVDSYESTSAHGRALVPADFDRDGRMDLLIINTDAAPTLLMNTTSNDHHWSGVELVDAMSQNSMGIGAQVTFRFNDGTQRHRTIRASGSYSSGKPPVAHVGLGRRTTIDSLSVRWPDGSTQVIDDPPIDRWLRIERAW